MSDQNTDQSQGNASEAAKAAETRARKAEKEATELKAAAKKREAAEDQARIDKEARDIDSAKRIAADATEREKRASAEADALRQVIKAQTDAKLGGLSDDDKARVAKYGDKLSLMDYAEFVDEEVKRLSNSAADASTGATNPPPPASAGGVTRVADKRGDGRDLDSRSKEILDDMAVPTDAARTQLEVIRDGDKAKFLFPPKKLIALMRERAIGPKLLSAENYVKLLRES